MGRRKLEKSKMAMKILRRARVLEKVGVSTATLYEWMANDKFPRSIKLGSRAVGWLESDIDDWITKQQSGPNA